ncbi:hypothetical protein C8Q80DRAFT_131009 [Daedaleopsis nitida]|nr:hypothetical protein C8Q80DRAFT_131009 [Daedaleopsis nitida]
MKLEGRLLKRCCIFLSATFAPEAQASGPVRLDYYSNHANVPRLLRIHRRSQTGQTLLDTSIFVLSCTYRGLHEVALSLSELWTDITATKGHLWSAGAGIRSLELGASHSCKPVSSGVTDWAASGSPACPAPTCPSSADHNYFSSFRTVLYNCVHLELEALTCIGDGPPTEFAWQQAVTWASGLHAAPLYL